MVRCLCAGGHSYSRSPRHPPGAGTPGSARSNASARDVREWKFRAAADSGSASGTPRGQLRAQGSVLGQGGGAPGVGGLGAKPKKKVSARRAEQAARPDDGGAVILARHRPPYIMIPYVTQREARRNASAALVYQARRRYEEQVAWQDEKRQRNAELKVNLAAPSYSPRRPRGVIHTRVCAAQAAKDTAEAREVQSSLRRRTIHKRLLSADQVPHGTDHFISECHAPPLVIAVAMRCDMSC